MLPKTKECTKEKETEEKKSQNSKEISGRKKELRMSNATKSH